MRRLNITECTQISGAYMPDVGELLITMAVGAAFGAMAGSLGGPMGMLAGTVYGASAGAVECMAQDAYSMSKENWK